MKNPRHILITGASSGLGAALAQAYAAPGVTLSLHGRDESRLRLVAAQATRSGAVIATHTGSVTDAADLKAWIEARDTALPIDLIIANAGISGGTSRGENADQVARIFATNVTGVFNTVQPALVLMRARKHGQIAIMSSLASFRGFAGAPAYCASKAAVRVYGEGLRGEFAPHGVEINVICPGFVKTPMTDANPFPMPFLMDVDRAVAIIRSELAHNRARIAFPWIIYMFVRLLAGLPQGLMDLIAHLSPKK
jgi:NAD(P)-dependent dehydrogenase (short-subunit alcohol dehydrogenase family)